MAMYRCSSNGGGGSTPTSYGTIDCTTSGAQDVTVNCGFQPKQIAIYFNGSGSAISGTTTSNGGVRLIYDSEVNNRIFRSYRISGTNNFDMATTSDSNPTIGSVTSTGFVFKKPAATGYNGTYYYFAIG